MGSWVVRLHRGLLATMAAVLCMGLVTREAAAMTFEVAMLRGEPAILAKGPIVAGDAQRLKAVLTTASRHSQGYHALVLESPGGSVTAALEMSAVIDRHPVNTYVAPGARCVSACAAILFIAGQEHVAVPGSFLGFHGCYNGATKSIEALCNERIADHAFSHGTAYGAVMALIQDTPHDQVVWLSGRDADCWAINRYVTSTAPANYEQCVRDMIRKFMEQRSR